MSRSVRVVCTLCAALFLATPLRIAHGETAEPEMAAAGAILIEASTGRVLLEKNADDRLPMASTTKVMTALLAAEYGELDALVAVPDSAYGAEGSSMYLHRGERIAMLDLLYGLMLRSGNDAALTIASRIGGSVSGFAEQMNARAQTLGCNNTHFVNPNGLPAEDHYTTARDLAHIAAAAMQNELFRCVVGTTYYETTSGDQTRVLQNKNRLLWQYEGGCGVKTGFTKAAGRCLVFAAERENMLLIGVVLNCPDMWNVAYSMLDYGFDAYEMQRLVSADTPLLSLPVARGERSLLEVYAEHDILYPVRRDGTDVLTWSLSCADALIAPVAAGSQQGNLQLFVSGAEAADVRLVVTDSVPRADVGYYLERILSGFIA